MKKYTLTACIAVATLLFYILNGGEDAPMSVQLVTLVGILLALLSLLLNTKVHNFTKR